MRSLPLVRHLQLMRSLPLVRSSYIGAGPLRGPAPSSRLRSRPQDGIRFMIALFIVIPGWKLPRSLGRVGLVILGVVDSSVIPTFGSLDALTARSRHRWVQISVPRLGVRRHLHLTRQFVGIFSSHGLLDSHFMGTRLI